MYDIPFDRSFLQLSSGIRHVMPSTDRKLELTAKASMAQPVSQPAVCSNGLKQLFSTFLTVQVPYKISLTLQTPSPKLFRITYRQTLKASKHKSLLQKQ